MQMIPSGGVSLGGGGGGVYMPRGGGFQTQKPATSATPQPSQPVQTLGAEAVRATGTGPYDNAYRQNLASYAGGFSQRPGGMLGFNPTGNIMGSPTGGGTAPVQGGMPDLLSNALAGGGFQAQLPQPTPQAGASTGTPRRDPLKFWLNQYQTQGNPFRGDY
jgi:hypothetical protein